MFEERHNLLNAMGAKASSAGTSTRARAREAKVHIERIRAILLAPGIAEGKDGSVGARKTAAAQQRGRPGAAA
jgi:hypothetical protein